MGPCGYNGGPMSIVDSEVLYLILTKVAAKESFYTYDPNQIPSSQKPGTITCQQLGEVYERITGIRTGSRFNWNIPLNQLNGFLLQCSLPALGVVVVTAGQDSSPALFSSAQATKWPPFGTLKSRYRK